MQKIKLSRISLAGAIGCIAMISGLALADYLGTATNRVFLDPASLPEVADGYQVGDEISFIGETTPDFSGSPVGAGAWTTFYVPAGVEVIGAELVSPNPDGTYSPRDSYDIAAIADDCGPRGCNFPTTGTYQNGQVNEVQQDTGIFYSIDPQTALLGTPPTILPTGTKPKDVLQNVYNQWDYNQVLAFGAKTPTAVSGNGGQGNTPVVLIGATWFGTGSPVAGSGSYYTNDYDPSCDASASFEADLACTGPWQRIQHPNAKIGGSGAIVPATTTGGPLLNTSVPTSSGHDFDVDGALAPNAVRFVFGTRRVGDLEYSRLVFRITDPAAFTASLSDDSFCLDSTGGDTDKVDRGPQDNNWRYYEGNNHTCFKGSASALLFKSAKFVNGVAADGGNLDPGDVISYEVTFYNTGTSDLWDIDLSDTPLTANLALVAAGSAGCAYPSYDGSLAGLPTFSSIAGNTATWDRLHTLAVGESVTVYMCAAVDGGAGFGDEVKNEATALYALIDGATQEPALTSAALGVISTRIDGVVYYDVAADGGLSAEDRGIAGATVELYIDNGIIGVLDALDVLVSTKTTTAAGSYQFNGFPADDYLVVSTNLAGYVSTGDIDTIVCATGNTCDVIAVSLAGATGSSLGNNFFDTGTGSIGDTVFNDANGNTVQDGSEIGIAGVGVNLTYLGSDGVLGTFDDVVYPTQTTGPLGGYDFTGLPPGDYIVNVDELSTILVGTTSLLTTANDPLSVSLLAGQDYNAADFGFRGNADISISKTLLTTGPFVAGQTIEYQIDVTNLGPDLATNLIINDTPGGITITAIGAPCNVSGFPCNISLLAKDGIVTVTVQATID